MAEMTERGDSFHVLFAGGGTGGHVFPALAVADQLVGRGHRVSFAGSHGLEETLVPEHGHDFHTLPCRALVGRGLVDKAVALSTLAGATLLGANLVRRLRSRVVVGTGGYVSAPAVLGARLLRRPCLLVEPNAQPGFANRQLSRFAEVAAVAFEETGRYLACPVEVTGVPVRREFGQVPAPTATDGPLRLLVVGGSQGAQVLNRALPTVLAALRDRGEGLTLVHQTGRDHLETTAERYRQAGVDPDDDASPVRVVRFLDDMAEAMASADLIVSRAGAITVAEITAASRPAIFVPLTLAEGHQRENARALERSGAALVVEEGERSEAGERDFAERLTGRLEELLDTPGRLAEMAERARLESRPAAAAEIADLVERLGSR